MNAADRRLLAEIRERDRKTLVRCRFTYVAVDGRPWECGYTQTVEYAHGGHEFTFPEGAAADRRELLRIVGDLEHLLRERADHADAAAEAEFLRPIGGGL